jgi:hypothetical protein
MSSTERGTIAAVAGVRGAGDLPRALTDIVGKSCGEDNFKSRASSDDEEVLCRCFLRWCQLAKQFISVLAHLGRRVRRLCRSFQRLTGATHREVVCSLSFARLHLVHSYDLRLPCFSSLHPKCRRKCRRSQGAPYD